MYMYVCIYIYTDKSGYRWACFQYLLLASLCKPFVPEIVLPNYRTNMSSPGSTETPELQPLSSSRSCCHRSAWQSLEIRRKCLAKIPTLTWGGPCFVFLQIPTCAHTHTHRHTYVIVYTHTSIRAYVHPCTSMHMEKTGPSS